MRNNFHEGVVTGVALIPQTINAAATANGATIVAPGRKGRQLTFILAAGVLTGLTVLTVKVQYNKNDGNGWLVLKQNDGTTDVSFPNASVIAASGLDSGSVIGTIPIDRAKDGDYRLAVTTVTGANIQLAATYVISEVFNSPTAQVDQLLQLIIPTGN